MNRKLSLVLIAILVLGFTGIAGAQQYGIGRFEQMQILSDDLRDASRFLYLRAERQYPRFGSDRYVLTTLYRLRYQAAEFEKQVDKNSDDPEALRRAYQRLYAAWYDAQYVMRGFHRFGSLTHEFEAVSRIVYQLSRTLPRYGNSDRWFYDRERDNDFDDRRDDRDYRENDDDEYEEYPEYGEDDDDYEDD